MDTSFYTILIEMRAGLLSIDPKMNNSTQLLDHRFEFTKKMSTIIQLLKIDPEIKSDLTDKLRSIHFSMPSIGYERQLWDVNKKEAVQFLDEILSYVDVVSIKKEQNFIKVSSELNSKEHNSSEVAPESNTVFIVYGHNRNMLNEVVRYLYKEKINPIILEDLANKGDTLIEKFEKAIKENNVNYAIVLFSPDDHLFIESDRPDELDEIYRVRQNILIELGYFMGKFGRGQTCVIFDKSKVEHNFEMPSDYQGVAWISYDGNWKDNLRTELKAANIL